MLKTYLIHIYIDYIHIIYTNMILYKYIQNLHINQTNKSAWYKFQHWSTNPQLCFIKKLRIYSCEIDATLEIILKNTQTNTDSDKAMTKTAVKCSRAFSIKCQLYRRDKSLKNTKSFIHKNNPHGTANRIMNRDPPTNSEYKQAS